jgi:NADH-quinone oxidoreductase subunit N
MIPAPVLNIAAALPLLLIAGGAFLVLALDLFLPRASDSERWRKSLTLAFASVGVLAAVIFGAASSFGVGATLEFSPDHPMFQLDRLTAFGAITVCLGAALALLLSTYYLKEVGVQHGEYYALVLLATSGMILLVGSVDLISAFLGIELMSIPIYVLAGFDRRRVRANESALKYFLAGSFASALLLYGMALLYGATGETSYAGIARLLDASDPLAVIGVGLVLVGFTFKVSAVPFHQWTPDVYEGAPASVTAYMSVTVKAAAFVALLRLVDATSGHLPVPLADGFIAALWAIAAATMIVGNLMAVIQDNVKRMLAYSSVAHAGYLLVGLVAASPGGYGEAYASVLFYLVAYLFLNLGAFGVIIALTHRGQDADRFDDYAGLAKRRPALAGLMTLFLIGLAGIPGTAGFVAKFKIFMAAVQQGYVSLVVIAVMTSLVSVYYYLRLPVLMYMREPGEAAGRLRLATGEQIALVACAVAVVVLGILPNNGPEDLLSFVRVLDWSREAAAALN